MIGVDTKKIKNGGITVIENIAEDIIDTQNTICEIGIEIQHENSKNGFVRRGIFPFKYGNLGYLFFKFQACSSSPWFDFHPFPS